MELKKYLNPTGAGGGGGAQSNGFGLVLLCNSGRESTGKNLWSHLLSMLASTLNKRLYKERRKRPKRGEFILNECDKDGCKTISFY